jgi:hypothetical protein
MKRGGLREDSARSAVPYPLGQYGRPGNHPHRDERVDQKRVEEHHSYDRVTDERTAGWNVEPSDGMMSRTGCVALKRQYGEMDTFFSTYLFEPLMGCSKSIVMPGP